MRIVNKTHWKTDHLRAFVDRVALDELDPEKRKRYVVEFVYNRGRGKGGYVTGCAQYHSRKATIRVASDKIMRVDLAMVIAHEMAHTRGMRHRMMKTPRYKRLPGTLDRYAWALTLPLEIAPKPVALPLDAKRAARLATATTALARWERKARLAANRVKKWKVRVRSIERTIQKAASAVPEAAPPA